MDSAKGARLLSSIWPKVDADLSEENRADRLRFISDLLSCFAANGVDLSRVMGLDEDVRSCAQHLGTNPSKPKKRTGKMTLDTSGLDDPVDYELEGGPLDGAVLRLGTGLYEIPPEKITLSAGKNETRVDGDAVYELQEIAEKDSNGNPSGSFLRYGFVRN